MKIWYWITLENVHFAQGELIPNQQEVYIFLGCDFNGTSFDSLLYDYRLKSINKEYNYRLLKWLSSHSKYKWYKSAHVLIINTIFLQMPLINTAYKYRFFQNFQYKNVNRKLLNSLVAWSNNVDRQMRTLIKFCIITCYYGFYFHYLPSAFCHSVEVIMIF